MNWLSRWWARRRHINQIKQNQARLGVIIAVQAETNPDVPPIDSDMAPTIKHLIADSESHMTELMLLSIDEQVVRRRW